jgi:hypothetical protein
VMVVIFANFIMKTHLGLAFLPPAMYNTYLAHPCTTQGRGAICP